MNKEYHWFEAFEDFSKAMSSKHEEPFPRAACGYFEAYNALKENYPLIYSDQSAWFNQNTIDRGYTLFAHFKGGRVREISRNFSINGRVINSTQNLEKLLLAGEFN